MITLREADKLIQHTLSGFTYISGDHIEYTVEGVDGQDDNMTAKFKDGVLVEISIGTMIHVSDEDEFRDYVSQIENMYDYFEHSGLNKIANDR